MTLEDIKANSLSLVESSQFAMVGSNGEAGFPNIKSMIRIDSKGLNQFWFSTNTSSKRVAQFKENPKACVYFSDFNNWSGLMLVGTMVVSDDPVLKQKYWSDGCEIYYPLGVTDPDYSILCFTAEWGNYYQSLENTTFSLNEASSLPNL